MTAPDSGPEESVSTGSRPEARLAEAIEVCDVCGHWKGVHHFVERTYPYREEHPVGEFHADHEFRQSDECEECGGTPDCHPAAAPAEGEGWEARTARLMPNAYATDEEAAAPAEGLREALAAIRDAHTPDPDDPGGMGWDDKGGYVHKDAVCRICGTSDEYGVDWPCWTHEQARAALAHHESPEWWDKMGDKP